MGSPPRPVLVVHQQADDAQNRPGGRRRPDRRVEMGPDPLIFRVPMALGAFLGIGR